MSKEISTDLATESATESKLPAHFEEQHLLALYQRVENEVKAEVPDITTKEGRARIKALAADVSRSKTAIDAPLRDYLRYLKSSVKPVEKNARESVERFDALRDELLKPLMAALEPQKQLLTMMEGVSTLCIAEGFTAQQAKDLLAQVEAVDIESFWQENQKKAKAAKEAAATTAADTLKRLELAEQQAAELAALRKQQAEAEQRERDRLIAEEAKAQAQREADEKLRRDREDAERRAAEARQREEDERLARQRAEESARLAEEQRKRDDELRAQREEQARKDAEEQQRLAVAAAEEAERNRLAEQQRTEQEAAERREADKAHAVKVKREILASLLADGDFDAAVKSGDPEKVARAVIGLSAKRMAGKMFIQY